MTKFRTVGLAIGFSLMTMAGQVTADRLGVDVMGKYCGPIEVTTYEGLSKTVQDCWTFAPGPEAFSMINTYVDLMDEKTYINIIKTKSPNFNEIQTLKDQTNGDLTPRNRHPATGLGHCNYSSTQNDCMDTYSQRMDNTSSAAEHLVLTHESILWEGVAISKEGVRYTFKGTMSRVP
jgi:hypothetical protein